MIQKRTYKTFLLTSIVLAFALTICANIAVNQATTAFISSDIEQVKPNDVGLLLGTGKYLSNGNPNPFFFNRIDAAVALFKSGKIKHVIISGDNSRADYNEPADMKAELVRNEIPDSLIYLDYAGFRTLDAVVRARDIFGQTSFVVISQQFHNERAVYLARTFGISAFGYNAKDVSASMGFRTKAREFFARDKMFLDLFFGVKPKFLGEMIEIKSVDENATLQEDKPLTGSLFKHVNDYPYIKDTAQFILNIQQVFGIKIQENPVLKAQEKITVFKKIKLYGSKQEYIFIEYDRHAGSMAEYPWKYQLILTTAGKPVKLLQAQRFEFVNIFPGKNPFLLTLLATAKGNGGHEIYKISSDTLDQVYEGYTDYQFKTYDAHEDQDVYEPNELNIQFLDANKDGFKDLVFRGYQLMLSAKTKDGLEYDVEMKDGKEMLFTKEHPAKKIPIKFVFLYDVKTGHFKAKADEGISSASDKVMLKEGLIKAYTQAISEYIKVVYKKDKLKYDTLFFGKHLDFPDIKLPETIDGTSIVLLTTEEADQKRTHHKSLVFINLFGWADRDKAEFIFVTFFPGYQHQYDYFINFTFNNNQKVFELEEIQFEDYFHKKEEKPERITIYQDGKYRL